MIRALPLLLAVLLAVLPERVEGCAAVSVDGGRVDVASETALIVWDAAAKVQHFIRRGQFTSTGYDFGFLVPTPSRPELDVADEAVFTNFERLTAPKIEHRTSYNIPFGCGGAFMMSAKVDTAAGGVMVLEQKKVGDYDAAVLGFKGEKGDDPATGAAELADWLKAHGYSFSPGLAAWLKPYVEQKWLVTAFKIGTPPPPTGPSHPGKKSLTSQPIRMSFKTERPFYPYREPEQMRDETAGQLPRLLRVYFVGAQRFAGTLGGGAWPGQTVWANKLGEADLAALPVKRPAGDLWLTEFEDTSRPRPGTDEVYFEPAADQGTVARPPTIITTNDGTPWVLGTVAVVGVGVWQALRALRRR